MPEGAAGVQALLDGAAAGGGSGAGRLRLEE
jgi:hypothetical protein